MDNNIRDGSKRNGKDIVTAPTTRSSHIFLKTRKLYSVMFGTHLFVEQDKPKQHLFIEYDDVSAESNIEINQEPYIDHLVDWIYKSIKICWYNGYARSGS